MTNSRKTRRIARGVTAAYWIILLFAGLGGFDGAAPRTPAVWCGVVVVAGWLLVEAGTRMAEADGKRRRIVAELDR